MKALIVEDETRARELLARTLGTNFPDIKIIGQTDSVASTVEFLREKGNPDVIFMDVELLDGTGFEIFRQVKVQSQVIMTTAYDAYAIKAFEIGSIDYLLKPIGVEALSRAVSRARKRSAEAPGAGINVQSLLAALQTKSYKEHLTVKSGDKIIPLTSDDIAFFFSMEKANYLMTFTGEKYIIESKIEQLEKEFDPARFFRISRGCIIHRRAIINVTRHLGGRLEVSSSPECPVDLSISRARVDDFLSWLE